MNKLYNKEMDIAIGLNDFFSQTWIFIWKSVSDRIPAISLIIVYKIYKSRANEMSLWNPWFINLIDYNKLYK